MRIDGQLEGLRGEGSQGRVIGAAGAGQWIKAIKQWAKGQRQASVELKQSHFWTDRETNNPVRKSPYAT